MLCCVPVVTGHYHPAREARAGGEEDGTTEARRRSEDTTGHTGRHVA